MASTQSSLKSILSAGVPTTSLPSIIQALAANSPTSAVKAGLHHDLGQQQQSRCGQGHGDENGGNPRPTRCRRESPSVTDRRDHALEVVNAVEAIETALGQGAGGLSLGFRSGAREPARLGQPS